MRCNDTTCSYYPSTCSANRVVVEHYLPISRRSTMARSFIRDVILQFLVYAAVRRQQRDMRHFGSYCICRVLAALLRAKQTAGSVATQRRDDVCDNALLFGCWRVLNVLFAFGS